MARSAGKTTEQALKDLATEEVAAAKERLAVRTAAARRFAASDAKLAEVRAALELAQGEATKAKGTAVDELLGSGMKPADVATLLDINAKELRTIRSAAQSPVTNAAVEAGSPAPPEAAKPVAEQATPAA